MNFIDRLSNTDGWVYLLIMAITFFTAIYVIKAYISFFKEDSPVKKKKAYKKAILSLTVFIVMIFFFFLNFGPGEPSYKKPFEESGEYKKLQETDEELTIEELDKDVNDNTTKELRIQSNDSLRTEYLKESEKKSDEAIEKYLN